MVGSADAARPRTAMSDRTSRRERRHRASRAGCASRGTLDPVAGRSPGSL